MGDWYFLFDIVVPPVFHQTTSRFNFTAKSIRVCQMQEKLIEMILENQIRIFVNEMGEIVCLGIKKPRKEEGSQKMYYYTDYTNLHINGRSAFATFAKPDEMVVILRLPNESIE